MNHQTKKFTMLSLIISLATFSHASELFEDPFRIKVGGKVINIDGGYVYPNFEDLDSDGVQDLIVGSFAYSGRIHFFKGIKGKDSYSFTEDQPLEFSDRYEPIKLSAIK